MFLPVEKMVLFAKEKNEFREWQKKTWKKGGVSDSWLDIRKRGGGVIQMRTVCNRGVGGSKNREKMRM